MKKLFAKSFDILNPARKLEATAFFFARDIISSSTGAIIAAIDVAYAAPSTPSCGQPNLPKMSA